MFKRGDLAVVKPGWYGGWSGWKLTEAQQIKLETNGQLSYEDSRPVPPHMMEGYVVEIFSHYTTSVNSGFIFVPHLNLFTNADFNKLQPLNQDVT